MKVRGSMAEIQDLAPNLVVPHHDRSCALAVLTGGIPTFVKVRPVDKYPTQ